MLATANCGAGAVKAWPCKLIVVPCGIEPIRTIDAASLGLVVAGTFAQTGYSMSGRNIAAGQTNAIVTVHSFPHPTAQITTLVFEDNQSINGAYDMPAEHGLSNFSLFRPSTWRYLAGYVRGDTLLHSGYTFAHRIYVNSPLSVSPWGDSRMLPMIV